MPADGLHDDLVVRIETITGHHFRDSGLLLSALTHPSTGEKHHYQRLEFLGDRVLGLIVAHWLYDSFPDEPEGRLNRRLAALVRKEALAEIAEELAIGDLIRLDQGAARAGVQRQAAVLADVMEALIGALYLDAGLEAARRFVMRHWKPRLERGPGVYQDAKSALQEWLHRRRWPPPEYRLAAQEGPDHAPVFEIEVVVPGRGSARAKAGSKRTAEQQAAARLLAEFDAGTNSSAGRSRPSRSKSKAKTKD
ncbi:MAG: ribonuclease III [Alphaproteobacteria bacterium]|nr:MAG: ribonuclease III [Alphaproteobacteria bacterium]